MLIEEANQLLKPGYMPVETGYYRLPNNNMYIAVLTRMPGGKGKMVDWWFGTYLRDTESYKKWDPIAHLYFEWDEHWKPGHYVGASHIGEELMADSILKFKMKLQDPSKVLDTSRFEEAKVGAVIFGEACRLPGEEPDGRVIHFVRDTDYGCEVRSRFWIYNGTDEMGAGHMEHCISEMGHLADFLPSLYEKEYAKQ